MWVNDTFTSIHPDYYEQLHLFVHVQAVNCTLKARQEGLKFLALIPYLEERLAFLTLNKDHQVKPFMLVFPVYHIDDFSYRAYNLKFREKSSKEAA